MPPKKKSLKQKDSVGHKKNESSQSKPAQPPALAKWSTAKGKKKAHPGDFNETLASYDSDDVDSEELYIKSKKWSPVSRSPAGETALDSTKEPEELPESIRTSLAQLRDYGSKITARTCSICDRNLFESFDLVQHVNSWPTLNQTKSQQRKRLRAVQHPGSLECSSTFCTGVTCLGCGEQHVPASDAVDWCCDEGRMVAIWMLLSCLDRKFLDAEIKTFATSNLVPLRSRASWHKDSSRKAKLPAGVGYTSGAYDDYSDYESPDDWDPELDDPSLAQPASAQVFQSSGPLSLPFKQDEFENNLKMLQEKSEGLKNQIELALANEKDTQRDGQYSKPPNSALPKGNTKAIESMPTWVPSFAEAEWLGVQKPQAVKKTKKKSGLTALPNEASGVLKQENTGAKNSLLINSLGLDPGSMLADLQRITESAKSLPQPQHQTMEELHTEWKTLHQLVSTTQQISDHLKTMEQNIAVAAPAPKQEEDSLLSNQEEKQASKVDEEKLSKLDFKQPSKKEGKKSVKPSGKKAQATKGTTSAPPTAPVDLDSDDNWEMELAFEKEKLVSTFPHPPPQNTSALPPLPPPLPANYAFPALPSSYPASPPPFPANFLPPPPPQVLNQYIGHYPYTSQRTKKRPVAFGAFDSDRRAVIVDNERSFLMLANLLPNAHKEPKNKSNKKTKGAREPTGMDLTPNVSTRSRGGPIIGGLGKTSFPEEIPIKGPLERNLTLTGYDTMMQSRPPVKQKPSTFDLNPPAILSTAVEYSFVLHMISRVISDDSIDRITEHKSLYLAMLHLVSKLHAHSQTAELITKASYVTIKGRSKSIYELTISDGDLTSGGRSPKDTNLPLAKSLEHLSVVSKSVLQTAEAMKKQYKDVKGLLSLCNRIEHVSREINPPTESSSEQLAEEVSVDHWKEFCAAHRVDMVDTDDIIRHYCYNEEKDKAVAPVPRGGASGGSKIKRLVHEVGSLRTSLPDGVFLKICSARPDIMKIVIIGPQDTAYAHGLYEFDLFCPSSYPYSPPLVHFKTPETIHINPNLHHSGTVCLSLLGTWGGSADESWRPGVSNLFQVLVSMQSMVFCSNPIANEPGDYGVPESHPRARQYNAAVQALNIRYGMLEWLRRMARDKPLWVDIVKRHFEEHATDMLRLAHEWSKGNEFVSSYGGWKTVEEACSSARLAASTGEGEIPGAMPVPHAPPGGRRSMWRAPARETVDLAQQLQTELEEFLGRKLDMGAEVKA